MEVCEEVQGQVFDLLQSRWKVLGERVVWVGGNVKQRVSLWDAERVGDGNVGLVMRTVLKMTEMSENDMWM